MFSKLIFFLLITVAPTFSQGMFFGGNLVRIVANGSVIQPNMRLSLIDGAAFSDFSGISLLTPYLGAKLILMDHTGKQAIGYIKAAGSGETYGSELLPNPSLETVASINPYQSTVLAVGGGQSGNALQVTTVTPSGSASQPFTASPGMLVLQSAYVKLGTAPYITFYIQDTSTYTVYAYMYWFYDTSWAKHASYFTAVSGLTGYQQTYGNESESVGQTGLFDPASVKQVLTPSTTGVTIVSIAGGSTQNWASIDASFNYNDSSGYTYTLIQ